MLDQLQLEIDNAQRERSEAVVFNAQLPFGRWSDPAGRDFLSLAVRMMVAHGVTEATAQCLVADLVSIGWKEARSTEGGG